MRCLLRLQNRCGNYLLPTIFCGIHSCVPEMLIQLGEAEAAVYLRPLEHVSAFDEGYALYLIGMSFVFELDSDTLFR